MGGCGMNSWRGRHPAWSLARVVIHVIYSTKNRAPFLSDKDLRLGPPRWATPLRIFCVDVMRFRLDLSLLSRATIMHYFEQRQRDPPRPELARSSDDFHSIIAPPSQGACRY